MRFGLSDLQELPSLKEFEALAREALGTDEGISVPGAGDESVLDGMPRNVAEGSFETHAAETHQPENAKDVESQPSPELAQAENAVPAEGISTQLAVPTQEPSPEVSAAEAPAVPAESDPGPDREFAETVEGKSHKAAAGE